MSKRIWIVAMLSVGFWSVVSYAEEGAETIKEVEKKLQIKRGELKSLRLRNPAYVLGEETQPTALRKRMPKAGDKKYYTSQVVDVRPYCVCEHAALADGGTKARHGKNHSKRSLDRTSPDSSFRANKLCPAWKQWDDAMKKIEETNQFNGDIDSVLKEIEELENKVKVLRQDAAEARNAEKGETEAHKAGKVKKGM